MQYSYIRSKPDTDLLCKVTAGIHKYSTCMVKEGCVLSCIIYVNISKARTLCCSKKIQN